jgi:hypothetical protein
VEGIFTENDSRPPCVDPTKNYLAGSLSKIMLRILGILWAAGCALRSAGWAAEPPAQRPNVVVIVTDDQRPDTIAALGNPVIRTPNLDALVRAGSTFTRAVCANPICTPSRAEILTGCSGFRNGVLDFGGKIDPQLVAWATAMQRGGYRTCYVGKWHNNGRPSGYGYDDCRGLFAGGGGRWWTPRHDHHGREVTGYRGWIFQTDDGRMFPELGVGLTPEIDARFAEAAIEYLIEPHGAPFFLHVNFTAPHDPLLMPPGCQDLYDPETIPLPDNFLPQHPFDHGNLQGRDEVLLPFPRTDQDVRADLAVYYAVISHLDQQVGRIVDALRQSGQWQRTILVFTSDHGLAVGSHGLRGKQNMYEHTIGVPLILCGPGVPAGPPFCGPGLPARPVPHDLRSDGRPHPFECDGKKLRTRFTGPGRDDPSFRGRLFPQFSADDPHRAMEADPLPSFGPLPAIRFAERSRGDPRFVGRSGERADLAGAAINAIALAAGKR